MFLICFLFHSSLLSIKLLWKYFFKNESESKSKGNF